MRQMCRAALNGRTCAMLPSQRNFCVDMPGEKKKRKKGTEPVDVLPPDDVLFGRSLAMQEVRRMATRIAGMNVPVLLNGNGGTGKEVVARLIHKHSPSSGRHVLEDNCSAITRPLVYKPVFGYAEAACTPVP